MSCNECERNVENVLKNIGGVHRVEADPESGRVEADVSDDVLGDAIHDAGYERNA
ncbi:heavy-metal-associated domain-containing protein [Halosolutus halophilus]|uniref:heavy-metal-associated domain-containing protein n=1 Tax=Halosolutus halophilus TaxID=1552990 RepID=UPI002235215B|nr:heavy-metal-associated domain-containing protein [Halosolutus halophilus]